MQQRLVRVNIELLLLLALHIGRAIGTQDIAEPGQPDLGLDHLGGERDAAQQPTKRSTCVTDALLPLQNMLLHGRNHRHLRILGYPAILQDSYIEPLHDIRLGGSPLTRTTWHVAIRNQTGLVTYVSSGIVFFRHYDSLPV